MTAYSTQTPPHAGLTATLAVPGGTTGDTAPTGNNVALVVINTSTTVANTVTLPIAATYDNLGVTSRSVAIPVAPSASVPSVTVIPLPSSVYGAGPQPVNYGAAVAALLVAAVVVPAG